METPKIVDLIQQQEWLQPIEEGLNSAVQNAYKSAGAAGQQVQNALNGTWLGHPLHPVLTDIPLGAWTTALVFDAMDAASRSRQCADAADTAVAIGLIGAVGSAVTGLTDWKDTDGAPRRTGVVHALLNVTATVLYTASLISRRKGARGAGRSLAAVGFALVGASAWLGGHLVYKDRIGVDHTSAGPESPQEFMPVLAESILLDGRPHRVEAGGYRVLLVKQNGRIRAIAESCSHLGGPLAEGKLEGDSICCPWHNSCFSLEDGRVLAGPATHPQPVFETRIQNGQIEVRAVRS